jgi:hypothetical protein
MPGSDYDIGVLNRLILAAAESVEESRACADIASDDSTRALHCETAEIREDVILELQTRVRELGGEPSGQGDPAPAIPMQSDTAAGEPNLVCHQDAEARMIELFKAALADISISNDTATVVRSCFSSVKRDRLGANEAPTAR